MCGAHATVRGLLGALVEDAQNGRDIIVDMEAGLEHLSRGTGRHVSRCLAVIEPYYRSMETARRIVALAAELGIAGTDAVANKVRDGEDRRVIREFCDAQGIRIVAEIPYDASLAAAERAGRPPIEMDSTAPAVRAIRELARSLAAA